MTTFQTGHTDITANAAKGMGEPVSRVTQEQYTYTNSNDGTMIVRSNGENDMFDRLPDPRFITNGFSMILVNNNLAAGNLNLTVFDDLASVQLPPQVAGRLWFYGPNSYNFVGIGAPLAT